MLMAKDLSISDLETMFPNEEEALLKLFLARREVTCPGCQEQTKYYRVRGRKCFECGDCGHQTYPCQGTIMEDSKLPVLTWLRAIYLTVHEKIGMSSIKLSEHLGIRYRAAWRMNYKIRALMKECPDHKLFGVVEIDETYCGGKKRAPKNKVKKVGHNGHKNKIQIVGMRSKSGEVRTFYIGKPTKKKLNELILDNVAAGSKIYTDQSGLYYDLKSLGYKHSTVNHSKFEWARGRVTTNRIEGIWSKLKRAWRGVYVHLRDDYIENYLQELDFKRTHCRKPMSEKFDMLIDRLFSSYNPSSDLEAAVHRYGRVLHL
jgi:transposase